MVLIAIFAGTLIAGVGSVWLAAILSYGALARYTQHMLSLAAGTLLATAFVRLLPEAFDSGASVHALSAAVLVGLVLFFLLDKAELWHHAHERQPVMPTLDEALAGENHPHAHHQPHRHGDGHVHGGGWALLTGDAVHCFGDGILIASTFLASPHLGWLATLAVLVHEVPHHMGDLAVLHRGNPRKQRLALIKVSLAGGVTVLGGMVGYTLVASMDWALPYLLALAASSFIYVALADLIPQLQKQLDGRQTVAQILWLSIGMALVIGVGVLGLGHVH